MPTLIRVRTHAHNNTQPCRLRDTPMFYDDWQEASWRADAEKYIQQKLAPVLSASKGPFITDVVAYETGAHAVASTVSATTIFDTARDRHTHTLTHANQTLIAP